LNDAYRNPAAADAPRPAHRLVVAAFSLYRRYPALFFILAATVVLPYWAIILAATQVGPLTSGSLRPATALLLELLDWSLVTPLISGLHVHAVAEALQGRDPHLPAIARKGLRVLPVVAAASIVSSLGIVVGFFALIVPGIFLMLRWAVVAQAAAIEHEGWLPALQRSHRLTDGHYRHVFVFLLLVTAIVVVPTVLGGLAFGDETTAASVLVGLPVEILTLSFSALATALLYFDLRARFVPAVVPESPPI
jgi:hypothetical protein